MKMSGGGYLCKAPMYSSSFRLGFAPYLDRRSMIAMGSVLNFLMRLWVEALSSEI